MSLWEPCDPHAHDTGFPPFELDGLRTFELQARPSKVFVEDLGEPMPPNSTMADFLDHLPAQLAAKALRDLCDALVRAADPNTIAACALGGHVVKTGCGPYLIDLIDKGVLKAVAMNGAAAIHDLELALAGKTSEDVAARLPEGSFGMARETADVFAIAALTGADSGVGLGRALGRYLDSLDCPHADSSILVQAYRRNIPCTVHVALGTDVVHMHPHVRGEALGASSMLDFRILTTVVSRLAGGLWMNLGCAVVMPEVFLKAVSIVRNFGHSLEGLVTANLDMIQHYRGRVNVCGRPSDKSISLTGHHEILIPLVHSIVTAQLAARATEDSPAEAVEAAAAEAACDDEVTAVAA
jgi:hypothetical protein